MIEYPHRLHKGGTEEMESEKLKRRKALLTNRIIPYFIGISGDLMFFIAINTLFLTVVKGLSATQISFLSTVTSLSYILMQIPALKLIQKIGNIKAIRLGTIMLLCSALLITFGNNYIAIIIGYILYQPSFLFKKMEHVVLKNNLAYLNKQDDYIKLANKSNIIYAVITTLIALIAGNIFAINHYMPMYLCLSICIINIVLSFCIFEANGNYQKIEKKETKKKIKLSKLIGIILTSFALLYPIINVGQSNTTLLIQYNLQQYFDVGLTATYLSFIIVSSRIARILGNILFGKLYIKFKDKVNLILSTVVILAFACVLIGSCLEFSIIVKFIWMTIGFDLILAVRDPFDTYMTDLLLKNTVLEEQQKAISYLQLSRRIVATMINLLFSLLLLKIDLFYMIICLMIFAIIGLGINIKLYKIVREK